MRQRTANLYFWPMVVGFVGAAVYGIGKTVGVWE